jgi:hypothetical protein
MNADSMFDMLREVSRLLNRAERSRDADERQSALTTLQTIHAELTARLQVAEAAYSAETSRKVEVVSLRAFAMILSGELAAIQRET